MRTLKWCLVVVAGLCFATCAKDPEVNSGPQSEEEINRWIYTQMSQQYLYNDYTKKRTLQYDQPCESFFKQLLSPLPTDNDGKHTGTKNYFYSYMERTGASKALAGSSLTYGMEYALYDNAEMNVSYSARVLYVIKGSPADRAGIRRGDWIRQVNQEAIRPTNTSRLMSGGATTFLVERIGVRDVGGFEVYETVYKEQVPVAAAEALEISPILYSNVMVQGAKRIGYLVYNAFEPGPNYMYDEELKRVFATFKEQQVNELILDLRYNGGGYFTSAQLLASMIVPERALGQVFSIRKYNPDMDARYGEVVTNFLSKSEMAPYNLNLNRLYLLTSYRTASASELIINCLRPYIPVYLMGMTTEGKNVGSVEIKSSAYALTLYPITQQAYNKNHESDYANGFTPDFYLNETSYQGLMLPLGDPDELMLRYTLALLAQTPLMDSRSVGTTLPPLRPVNEPFVRKRVQGLIFTDQPKHQTE